MPKNSTKALALKPVIEKAVEVYASKPDIQHKDAAKMLKISENTLLRLRRDPSFWAQVYDYYMVTFEGDVVGVLRAMVREGLAGNVQAGRLVLEHSGKLQKNINVTISSPYEKWLEKVEGGKIEDAEIVEDEEIVGLVQDLPNSDDLPARNTENQQKRVVREKKTLNKSIKAEAKRQEYNKKQKEWYKWRKRAEKVGVSPLKSKRPTKGQRKLWQELIIEAEKLENK